MGILLMIILRVLYFFILVPKNFTQNYHLIECFVFFCVSEKLDHSKDVYLRYVPVWCFLEIFIHCSSFFINIVDFWMGQSAGFCSFFILVNGAPVFFCIFF